MQFSGIQAIDAHGHYGRYIDPAQTELVLDFGSADATEVARRAHSCGIEWTMVSPFTGLFHAGVAMQ